MILYNLPEDLGMASFLYSMENDKMNMTIEQFDGKELTDLNWNTLCIFEEVLDNVIKIMKDNKNSDIPIFKPDLLFDFTKRMDFHDGKKMISIDRNVKNMIADSIEKKLNLINDNYDDFLKICKMPLAEQYIARTIRIMKDIILMLELNKIDYDFDRRFYEFVI